MIKIKPRLAIAVLGTTWLSFMSGILIIPYYSYHLVSLPKVAPHLSQAQFQTQKKYLINTMESAGLGRTFSYVTNRITSDPSFARDCHPLLHELGHAAYEYLGGFQQSMQHQNEICDSGYTHGVLEEYLSRSKDTMSALLNTCSSAVPHSFSAWQCEHGIGHGIMLVTSGNLSQSLKFCQLLGESFNTEACANGVYMQHFLITDHNGDLPKTNPTSLNDCRGQPSIYRSICYAYAPTAYLALDSGKYLEATWWCQNAESAYIDYCFSGIGSQAMKDNINNPEVSKSVCSNVELKHQASCVSGAISLYILFQGSSSSAKPLCQNEFKTHQYICDLTIKSAHSYFSI